MGPQTNSSPLTSSICSKFSDSWPLPGADRDSILDHLHTELACPTVAALYPHMRWFANKSGRHIDALHNNIVKAREVVVTEDPELHLVSRGKTVWVKPVPIWLLDSSFWDTYLSVADRVASTEDARRHATGFLHSYTRLIRHESDFILGQEKALLPRQMSFLEFQRCVSPFRNQHENAVAPRYHFGQIRLSRLNWAIRFCQPEHRRYYGTIGRLYYHQPYWDLTGFIRSSIAPFIFIFGTVSVILSSMQVALAVKETTHDHWDGLEWASWVFSVAVLIFIPVFLVFLVLVVFMVIFAQSVLGRLHNKLERSGTEN